MPYFCECCWLASELLDPVGRCLQCFESIEQTRGICWTCKKEPKISCPRAFVFAREAPICKLLYLEETLEAIAALAFYQSTRLHWPMPDVIVPVLARPSEITHRFAAHHKVPCPEIFVRHKDWTVREELIDEDLTIWLFDEGATTEELQLATQAIAHAFPKRVYLLSLLA